MKKKILSILLVLSMLLGISAVIPVTVFAADVTLSNADIVINSVSDWMSKLSGKTIGDQTVFVNASVLDFDDEDDVAPIEGFTGHFNGNGVIIKNMNITTTGETGIFHCITGDVIIENLVIEDSYFQGKEWVGAVICCIGAGSSSTYATVRNIYIGQDVTVFATKNGEKAYAGGIIGGIAGNGRIKVTDCVFEGKIDASSANTKYMAGIVGNLNGKKNVTVNNCLVTGIITNGDPNNISGVMDGGSATGSKVDYCISILPEGTSVTEDYRYSRGVSKGSYNWSKIRDVYGLNALANEPTDETNLIDEFTVRDKDIMIPKGVKALETLNPSFKVPASIYYGTVSEAEPGVVTFKNWDGEVLQSSEMAGDEMPEYTGETPTKPDEGFYSYTFKEWTPYISKVNGSAEYTATFTKTLKVEELDEENGKYVINNVYQYLYFMNNASDYSGETVVVGADLDFEGAEDILKPITGFSGTFDGNGKTFSNIVMSGNVDVALFGDIGENELTVQDLTIRSSAFEATQWVATIVSSAKSSNLVIKNIYVASDVTIECKKKDGNSIAGGILGGVYGTAEANVLVENCVFAGTIIGTGDSVAGIVASVEQKVVEGVEFNTVTVRNCLNAGTLVGNNHVAGIISGQGMIVENCVNAGTVRAKGKLVGAIAVTNPNTDVVIDGCYYANGALLSVGDRGDSLVEYGSNEYADLNKLIGSNAKAPATFTKRSGDLAVPAGCTNVNDTLVTIKMLDGAAVRLSDPSGLRFTAILSAAYLDSFKGDGKTVSFGILVAPTDYVIAAGGFTVDALAALGYNVNYKEIAADKLQNDYYADESYVFTGVLAPIQTSNYTRAFSAIAYIKVVDANGNAIYYYSDYDESANSRSIANVAEAAYSDTSPVKTEGYRYALDVMVDEEVDGTITNVNKTVYSPYTIDERDILMGFYREGDAINISFLSYNIRNIEDKNSIFGAIETPYYEYDGREEKVLKYLTSYGADVIGLQEVSTLNKNGGRKDWFTVLNRAGDGLTANGYTCVYGKNLYWGEDYSTDLASQHEKTMYNPIYFKTDKFNLIDWDVKWLTSTPDQPSQIQGMDTFKGLTYVILEEKATGEQFIYVNLHYVVKAESNSDGNDKQYVYDTEGNKTDIWAQELETIYLRAILNDIKDEYDLPMFISGDFNNNNSKIKGWFEGSYLDVETQIVSSEESTVQGKTRYMDQIVAGQNVLNEKPDTNDEDVTIEFAGSQAIYTSGKALSSSAGSGNFSNLGEGVSNNVIDLWFVSDFDGIVHTYEIIDNKFEEPNEAGDNNRYPSDHLPAKLYVTLYTK